MSITNSEELITTKLDKVKENLEYINKFIKYSVEEMQTVNKFALDWIQKLAIEINRAIQEKKK